MVSSKQQNQPLPTPPQAGIGRTRDPSLPKTVRMTAGSVRNRFGRMTVTWIGIALGISFLMSAMVSSSLRQSLQEVTDRRADTESMLGTLRGEVGNLGGKSVVIVVGRSAGSVGSDRSLSSFVDLLRARSPTLVVRGPVTVDEANASPETFSGASAVISWQAGEWGSQPNWPAWVERMKQLVVLSFGAEPAMDPAAASLVRTRELLPPRTAEEQARLETRKADQRNRLRWLVGVSLLVAAIGISNALLMSVSERYREIGTMKCLGASNRFVIRLVLLESAFLGITGALAGMLLGLVFGLFGFVGTYGFATVFAVLDFSRIVWGCLSSFMIGWIVAVLAALYPAGVAARMVAADALRSEV